MNREYPHFSQDKWHEILPIDDAEWLARVSSNLEGRRLGAMNSVFFLYMVQGDAKTKKEQIQRCRDQESIFTEDREELEAFATYWFARNPFLYETTRLFNRNRHSRRLGVERNTRNAT